ncbi:hypothetical protein KJ966_22490 [bacterium]|nr:hypothetical protein [bacterium]
MLHENEVLMLFFGIIILFFVMRNLQTLKRIHSIKLLLAGFCFSLSGWLLTLVEGF